MKDLLVITPTRGRPWRLAEMLDATLSLSQAQTDVAVAYDSDDPASGSYKELSGRADDRVHWYSGPQQAMTGWTNHIALERAHEYRALASLSDDHVPRTEGWDSLLLGAIDGMGGTGFAYGNDLLQGANLPTAVVVSSNIVTALGWMAPPEMRHYCIDNVWKDLGDGAGCLAYRPDVTIEHCHPGAGKAVYDATYAEEARRDREDQAAYDLWREQERRAAVAVVVALRNPVPPARVA